MRFAISLRELILCLLLAGCAHTGNGDADAAESFVWAETPPAANRVQAPSAAPILSKQPSLDELLRVALRRNPRIQAARERAAAAAEAPAIERALPDPRFLLGWYETPIETRVGPQEWSLGVRQAIPFPSKLSARSDLSETLARRAVVAYERVVRDVLVEVVGTVHELLYLDDAIEISAGIGGLLERYAAAAGSEVPLNEVFRAETQRAQLENDRALLAELRATEAEHLRALLDLPGGQPIRAERPPVPPPVHADFDELVAIAEAHNQELKEAGLDVEAAALATSLARRDRLPDLTLGYTRLLTGTLDPSLGNPPGNGRDAQIFHFDVTLPIWGNKNRAKIRRAEALERAATRDRADTRLRVRHRLARSWYRVGNTERLVRLYADVLVPRAAAAAETAEELQEAGKGTLAGTVETIAVLHNFRLAAARARADHGQAVADLEGLLGRPLALDAGGER